MSRKGGGWNPCRAYVAQGMEGANPVYKEMAALFQRLGGGEPTVPKAYAETSAPYRAILRPTSPRFNPRPSSLTPYERGRDEESRIICEFHDPLAFLGALLATGQAHRIEWPDWLRQAFLALLKQLLAANTPPPRASESSSGDHASFDGPPFLSQGSTKVQKGGFPI